MHSKRVSMLFACLTLIGACSSSSEPAAPTDHDDDPAKPADDAPKHDAATVHTDAGKTAPHEDAAVSLGAPDAGEKTNTDPPPPANSSGGVTYQRDIRPLLENNCVECHTQGGIGPSTLDDWKTVETLGNAIVAAVGAGRMPPWPASSECHPIADSRALSKDVKDLFAKWKDDGFQEGNVADYVAPEKRHRLELGAPALSMKGDDSYTPAVGGDSYRCFFAGTVAEDTFISALDIVPSARSEVHHVQLHRVAAADVASVQSQDRNAAGGGYACNSAGVGGFVSSQNLFSYRPGGVTVVMEQGSAVYLKGGSGLVLQVHYNTQFLPAGEVPVPDNTRVDIWTLPKGEVPEKVVYRTGLLSPLASVSNGQAGLFSSIPANAKDVVGGANLKMSGVSVLGAGLTTGAVTGKFLPGEIVGMTPHAHAWATRMVASLTPSGGSQQCLIEVPDWDYNWQLDYMFSTGVPYGPNDMLHVECDYDNTADNQPIINGSRRPVQTITFGESTLNEMCEHYLWLRFSYADFKAASP